MNNEIDSLIRDITKAGFMPKSEARRRIMDLLAKAKEEGNLIGYKKACDEVYAQMNREVITKYEEGQKKGLDTAIGYLQATFGDGNKALCILESHDGGNTQRPALPEIVEAIKKLK